MDPVALNEALSVSVHEGVPVPLWSRPKALKAVPPWM